MAEYKRYPTNIFAFWTGPNVLSPNRIRCLYTLRKNSGCDVILIHEGNLQDWIIPNTIHPSYQHLSFTHRADYLRCYFAHYYGGGYSDIKQCSFNWSPFFELLYENSNALMVGYPEQHRKDIAIEYSPSNLPYMIIPGMGQFIFKSKTSLTWNWLQKVHTILDYHSFSLEKYPGNFHPRAVNGGVHSRNIVDKLLYRGSKYPLFWNEILGSVLHPLLYTYAFAGYVITPMPYIDTANYQ